eukprot:2589107-Ditylum_brightwellii.AAC.1
MGFCSFHFAPPFHSALSIQFHPPPHIPVTGCTATDSTFNHPYLGFEPTVLDFQDSTKYA